MSFVDANVTTDPSALLDEAIAQINSTLTANGYPDWAPSDGDLAVVLLQAVAYIAADVATVAATVLPAVFRAFGTQLLGIPYNAGAPATVMSTWSFSAPAPTGGYVIDGGTPVLVGGQAFYTQQTVVTQAGVSATQILLVASETGAAYNSLGGVNAPAALVNEIDWVTSVTTAGYSSNGVDPQTDQDYQNELSQTLTLQAPRPILAVDFGNMALSSLANSATGVTVGRASSVDNYYPDGRALSTGGASAAVITVAVGSGQTLATVVAPSAAVCALPGSPVAGQGAGSAAILPGTTVATSPSPSEQYLYLSQPAAATGTYQVLLNTTGYGPTHLIANLTTNAGSAAVTIAAAPYYGAVPDVGARVYGTNIPSAAVVAATPPPGSAGFSLSVPATGTGTQSATISSWTSVARCVTTYVTDSYGNALSAAKMDSLQTWLQSYREAMFLAFVTQPTYTTVYVNATVHVLPGYSAPAVAASVQSALSSWLSPATWGQGPQQYTGSQWFNFIQGYNVVRYNKAIGVIESVPGVDYVLPGSAGLALGSSATALGAADLTLYGPAPLPMAGALNVATA